LDNIIVILLIIAVVKFILVAIILYWVFRPDLRLLQREWESEKKPQTVPTCMYCQSKWTKAVDEGETRWDNDELVLVTTYECQHCHLPFWHVERVATGSMPR
jgi:hypothetical protein